MAVWTSGPLGIAVSENCPATSRTAMPSIPYRGRRKTLLSKMRSANWAEPAIKGETESSSGVPAASAWSSTAP